MFLVLRDTPLVRIVVLEATSIAKTTHKNPHHHGRVLLSDVANVQQKEEEE